MSTISNPRPLYTEKAAKPAAKRLKMGTRDAGIIIDATKEGIEVNGYYSGLNERNTVFSILSMPIFIAWEDLEKVKAAVFKRKRKKYIEFIDEVPDKTYLGTLPIVELNKIKFYVDAQRHERRKYSDPSKVVKF